MEAKYGSQIQKMRKAHGLTQIQLANKAKIALSSLRRYEADERQPTMRIVEQLASALGISVADFLWSDPKSIEKRGATLKERVDDRFEAIEVWGRKKNLVEAFDTLNDYGQKKAIEQVEDLAKIPEYQKEKDNAKP